MSKPIPMDMITATFIRDKMIGYRQNHSASDLEISNSINVPLTTVKSWTNGRNMPSEKHMPQVLNLLGLHERHCLRCQLFLAVQDSTVQHVLCQKCAKLHHIVNGEAKKK